MKEIPFVKKEHAAFAREMEQRMLEVREDAGIQFVGVSVQPTLEGENPTYFMWVGISRDFSEALVGPLVDVVFREEILNGTFIRVEAHRGVVRT